MNHYHYFDRILESELSLPELAAAPAAAMKQDVVVIRRATEPVIQPGTVVWYEHPTDAPGAVDMAYGKAGSRYVMRFTDAADFSIDVEAGEILWYASDRFDRASLCHLLLDQALPRLLGQSGQVVLHASAVMMEDGALGFIGRSGWGKSTLAASIARDQSGSSGDDALMVGLDDSDQPWCVPAYYGARLWEDTVSVLFGDAVRTRKVAHYSAKLRVEREGAAAALSGRLPLQALFLLNDPQANAVEEIQIHRLNGSAPLMAVLQRCFLLDPHDMSNARRLWLEVGSLLRSELPVYQLSYPRNLEDLSALRTSVLSQVQSTAVTQAPAHL